MNSIVTQAYEIIMMHEELIDLRAENARLRGFEKKYNDLVMSSIHHSEAMMGQLLRATITGALVAKPELRKPLEGFTDAALEL